MRARAVARVMRYLKLPDAPLQDLSREGVRGQSAGLLRNDFGISCQTDSQIII